QGNDDRGGPAMRTEEAPRLREHELRHSVDESMPGIFLVDPTGLFDAAVFVPRGLIPVLQHFNGRLTCSEIAEVLSRDFGQAVTAEAVARVAADLEGRSCLDDERTRASIEAIRQGFLASAVRPMRHCGPAEYPRDGAACAARLDALLDERPVDQKASSASSVLGLISPHIDLQRGARGYAAAYGALQAAEDSAELFVVFGTAHRGSDCVLTVTDKSFETPFGVVDVDRDFVHAVGARLDREVKGATEAWRRDEYLHRDEHSLEFQVLLTHHVQRQRQRPCRIAPFLTGALPLGAEREPMVRSCVSALVEACRDVGVDKVTLIAGADLSHIGPFFGDSGAVTDKDLDRVRAMDGALLQHAGELRSDALQATIEADGNPSRVCGGTPCWFVTEVVRELGGGAGELLHYEQAVAEDRSQCVSFAAMSFPRPPSDQA
ncbi:MAG TPA: AmmeMemoRadiSam system protein B, partial [Planctomycetota bacterium]|nr:AmmeMemoRadiSam system protein B [Planctomycetota bacterium]